MEKRLLVMWMMSLGLSAGCGEKVEETSCLPLNDDGTCPSVEEAEAQLLGPTCDGRILSVDGEAEIVASSLDTASPESLCCYPVTRRDEPGVECVEGRPLKVEGAACLAPLEAGDGWAHGSPLPTDPTPGSEVAAALAADWRAAAQAEHASIAAFHTFALDLMRFGAPKALLEAAHAAARDELRHAERCLALASRFEGAALQPGALPLPAALSLSPSLAALAVDTLREGAVGESLSTLLAEAALAHTTDPEAQRALRLIAHDEARHATLAWQTVQWCLQAGGDDVRDALVAEAARLRRDGAAAPPLRAGEAPAFRVFGRLSAARAEAVIAAGMRGVILPLLDGLLGAPSAARAAA